MGLKFELNEDDFWIFPDMTKFFIKANIVFSGFDRKNGIHTLVYCISPACYCFVANIVLQNILIKQHRDDVRGKNEEFGYYQVR
jgi:hypothetical protein